MSADLFSALRALRRFIEGEIEARAVVGDDQAEYRDAPREAFAAFMLLRNEVLDGDVLTAAQAEIASLRAQLAEAEGVLGDVEGVFAFLETDIETSMADDEDEELDCAMSGHMCGHSFCDNTGCVSLRLFNIRVTLAAIRAQKEKTDA